MPSRLSNKQVTGQYYDTTAQGSGAVNAQGQVAIQFHATTKPLKYYLEKAQQDLGLRSTGSTETLNGITTFIDENFRDLPVPRLNIAIHICGSRGDVQPFIAIAKLLQAPPSGHRVRICTHPVFKDFVESNGIEFFSIGGDPEALMAYMVKNPGLLPGIESIKAGDISKRRKEMAEMVEGTWRSCIEAGNGMGEKTMALGVGSTADLFIADAIIANPPSMGHIHCAEKLGIPLHIVFTMPWSPTREFHHPLAAMDYGEVDKSLANYFSFTIMELLTWQGLGDVINKFRTQTLKLDPISPLWGHQLIPRLRVPHSYLWSRTLIPKPSDWGAHVNVTGFSFLNAGSKYTPPNDLFTFINSGPTPVYIGFGSIVVDDPVGLTKLIFEAVKLAQVRAIVSKGWGGVGAIHVPEDIYLIGNCPHDWLFQQVSCVVHHGGAGTTAAGIALGKPTVVVPFFGDQPFWGQMIWKAGAGPQPVPFKQLTAESLAASILFALKDEVRLAVQEMANNIAKEDGATETVEDVIQKLQVNNMRCSICPERLAVWQEKRTGARLSSFAVCVLAEAQLLEPKNLRLLRHRHWYVHEGAEGPALGAVAAIAGFVAAVGNDTKDFSRRLEKLPQVAHEYVDVIDNRSCDPNDLEAPADTLSSEKLDNLAWRMAIKSYEKDPLENFSKPSTHKGLARVRAKVATKKARSGRMYQITSATAHYAYDLSTTGARVPVAFFYNVANGFRNFPSYVIRNEVPRRRDEITGIGSGVSLAGKEFVLGIYEAVSGILRHPYLGAQFEGPLGIGKGVGRGLGGFVFHSMAAIFGLPGYILKGLEKELLRQHLTTLQAEIYLIRLRQASFEFRRSTPAERAEVITKWASLQEK